MHFVVNGLDCMLTKKIVKVCPYNLLWL